MSIYFLESCACVLGEGWLSSTKNIPVGEKWLSIPGRLCFCRMFARLLKQIGAPFGRLPLRLPHSPGRLSGALPRLWRCATSESQPCGQLHSAQAPAMKPRAPKAAFHEGPSALKVVQGSSRKMWPQFFHESRTSVFIGSREVPKRKMGTSRMAHVPSGPGDLQAGKNPWYLLLSCWTP